MKIKYRLAMAGLLVGIFCLCDTRLSLAKGEIFTIKIKDHKFEPAEITIPANQKVKLIIENYDPTAEEFESYDLNREKIVTGNGKITVFVGPLKPGEYKYFGEFHPETAQGLIEAQ